jgi:AraC family transcriptional activator of mtrCDE
MVLAALPAVVVLAATEGGDAARLRGVVEMIQTELEEDRLDSAPIASALAGSLMMFVLRAHFESELTDPARGWTLDELAARANTSRATLVRLFRTAANTAPLAFLTLARHRILATRTPLAVIAEEVGYQSETAFSRAYQRRFGVAPGADRKGGIGVLSAAGR